MVLAFTHNKTNTQENKMNRNYINTKLKCDIKLIVADKNKSKCIDNGNTYKRQNISHFECLFITVYFDIYFYFWFV